VRIDFSAQIASKGFPLEELTRSFPCNYLHSEIKRSPCLNIEARSQMSLLGIRFTAILTIDGNVQ
jgi:hypothetical protein